MDITYLGGHAFLLKGDRTIAINPPAGTPRQNITLQSARRARSKEIVNGPGEYEIGGCLIVTLEVGPRESSELAHAVEISGLNVVHLGTTVRPLNDRAVADIGRVDILLLNADDLRAAQAAVTDLTPRLVIPYGAHAAELCGALGVKDARPQPRLTWNGISAQPKAVLLKPATAKRRAA
jgi:hypothetical protein